MIGLQQFNHGIPADRISEVTGKPIPGNLYYEIAQREERIFKGAEEILYDTTSLPETIAIYDKDNYQETFTGKIIEVFTNLDSTSPLNGKNNLVILDQSLFYPTQGGQECDHGILNINNVEYKVVDCIKVGKCAVHVLDKELPGEKKDYIGKEVNGKIIKGPTFKLRGITSSQINERHAFSLYLNFRKKKINKNFTRKTNYSSLVYK